MEKFITASDASYDEMKRIIYDFNGTKKILKEARDEIENGFKDLKEKL